METENVLAIPKNATNGDVIRTIFPNAEIITCENEEMEISEYVIKIDTETIFTAKWWNTPYERKLVR